MLRVTADAKCRALVAANPAMREKTDDVQQKPKVASRCCLSGLADSCRVRRSLLRGLPRVVCGVIGMEFLQLAGEGPALRDQRS
jgi:hypothetical protein